MGRVFSPTVIAKGWWVDSRSGLVRSKTEKVTPDASLVNVCHLY